MKRLIAAVLTLTMLFAFASCKDGVDNPQNTPEVVTDSQGETVTDNAGEVVTKPANTEISVDSEETTAAGVETTAPETTLAPITLPDSDPATWTKEQVVEFYRNAAINSKSKKSVQKMTLKEMVVNDGDGLLGNLVEMITPFLISALEDSSTEFDGITGGYEKLVPDDAQSARAYRSGEYIVVEMTMKEQIDGVHGDLHSGTVGHAISVVGDLKVVEEALPNFEIRFEEAEIKLHYKNPTLKVKISKDGVIEKGTWTYNVYVTAENLYIGGRRLPLSATVKSAYGTVDYIITTGGGF